ncbi:glycerol-3-phosphate dehydrogenase/oxidase [Rickettsiales bacterium LUAb2]
MAIANEEILKKIQNDQFDLIIIGGGATGLGTAVDAVTRGYKTLLIEKTDFAKATSSRSTKLAHGGVRYLAQGNISLVKSALHEKIRMEQNAPFLVKNCPFVIPCYNYFDIPYYYAGLKAYDILGGGDITHKSKFLSKQETTNNLNNIKNNGLKGGIEYHDAVFDDARMAISLLRTFIDRGGVAVNYTEVTGFIKQNNKITGVTVVDQESQQQVDLKTKCVINATGIFSDKVRQLDEETAMPRLKLAQGIHLVLDRNKFNNNVALLIPKTVDKRVLFIVPWHDKVLCGTTDTNVDNPVYEPKALESEIDFVIKTSNDYMIDPISNDDVLSVYAGIRPLVLDNHTSTSKIARDDKVYISNSGLVTIAGGKWTTYRKMGEKVLDFAIQHNLLDYAPCITYSLKLHGFVNKKDAEAIPESYRVYGSDYKELSNLAGFNDKLHEKLSINKAQIEFAVEHEYAKTVDDILARRTRSLFFNAKAAVECANTVAEIMAKKLGKDKNWQQQQISDFKQIANNYILN